MCLLIGSDDNIFPGGRQLKIVYLPFPSRGHRVLQ